MIQKLTIVFLIFGMLAFNACSGRAVPEDGAQPEASETASTQKPEFRETTIGPVHAAVTLSSSNPSLSDPITLTLAVDAAPDVVVTMPEFGDQMSQFNIADYKATEKLRDDGRYEFTQTYTLDLPMSGRLTTPVFLVEFTDNRAGAENFGKLQELLTEAIAFDVSSVFADGQPPEQLYPMKEKMDALVLPTSEAPRTWIWGIAAASAVILACGILAVMMRRRRKTPELPPDAAALNALNALADEGMPTDDDGIDAWYVRLSGIVRTYIEGRFGLNAPCQTTEEFFELARQSGELGDQNKRLIRHLLECSDRVKFTSFRPTEAESLALLAEARQFVVETRANAEDNASAASA